MGVLILEPAGELAWLADRLALPLPLPPPLTLALALAEPGRLLFEAVLLREPFRSVRRGGSGAVSSPVGSGRLYRPAIYRSSTSGRAEDEKPRRADAFVLWL